jgi:hypothetical protein
MYFCRPNNGFLKVNARPPLKAGLNATGRRAVQQPQTEQQPAGSREFEMLINFDNQLFRCR